MSRITWCQFEEGGRDRPDRLTNLISAWLLAAVELSYKYEHESHP
jgi:hypothetical protein